VQKEFTKLEKPIKETYVLFSINSEQGLAMVEEKNQNFCRLLRTL
jgi:hypothetical protein